MLVVLIARN